MKKLLIAEELQPLMLNAMSFLQRSEIAVLSARTNDDILKLHITQNANLIVTKSSTPGLACETLVHTIRRGEIMRKVSIILLCGNNAAEQQRGIRCGVNAVIPEPVDAGLLAHKVQDLLEVAPRRYYRVVLNVSMEGKRNNQPFLCSSLNVSAKGMLLRTTERLAPGENIACSFYLPDGKRISASGEIARIVRENSGSDANQYGVRFTVLSGDAEKALTGFVEKEMRRTAAPETQSASLVA